MRLVGASFLRGVLVGIATNQLAWLARGDASWTDYILHTDVAPVSGTDQSIVFRHGANNSRYGLSLHIDGGVRELQLWATDSGGGEHLLRVAPAAVLEYDKTFGFKIIVQGNRVRVFMGEKSTFLEEYIDYTDGLNYAPQGRVGLAVWSGSALTTATGFDNFAVQLCEPSAPNC